MARTISYFSERLMSSVKPVTKAWVVERAAEECMTPSAFVRRVLEEAAKRDLQGKDPD